MITNGHSIAQWIHVRFGVPQGLRSWTLSPMQGTASRHNLADDIQMHVVCTMHDPISFPYLGMDYG